MNRDERSYQLSHVWDKLLHTDDRHRKSVLMKASEFRREAETSINSRLCYFGCIRVINIVFLSA